MTVDTAAVPENKKNNLSIVRRRSFHLFHFSLSLLSRRNEIDEMSSGRCVKSPAWMKLRSIKRSKLAKTPLDVILSNKWSVCYLMILTCVSLHSVRLDLTRFSSSSFAIIFNDRQTPRRRMSLCRQHRAPTVRIPRQLPTMWSKSQRKMNSKQQQMMI